MDEIQQLLQASFDLLVPMRVVQAETVTVVAQGRVEAARTEGQAQIATAMVELQGILVGGQLDPQHLASLGQVAGAARW